MVAEKSLTDIFAKGAKNMNFNSIFTYYNSEEEHLERAITIAKAFKIRNFDFMQASVVRSFDQVEETFLQLGVASTRQEAKEIVPLLDGGYVPYGLVWWSSFGGSKTLNFRKLEDQEDNISKYLIYTSSIIGSW